MKRKVKPAAKIFIAASIVGIIFFCYYKFVGVHPKPIESTQIVQNDSLSVDSLKATVEPSKVDSAIVNVSKPVSLGKESAVVSKKEKQVDVKIKKEVKTKTKVIDSTKPKNKKSKDRENLNVNF